MALGNIMRLLVVTVFCVFGTTGLTTRKLSATVTTMPATTQELTTTQPSGTSGSVTTNTATNRPDGLLNKYDITATASASASSTASASASASAAYLTNPPPLRQPVPEPLTVDHVQQSSQEQAQHSITSQSQSNLHLAPTHQQNNLHGGPPVSSVPDTRAIAMSQQTTSSPDAVPIQTETRVPNSFASVHGAVYQLTKQPELTPGPTSVPNTHAEAPHTVPSVASVGQRTVSGHTGVTATESITSTAHTQNSVTVQQQPTLTQLYPGKVVEAAATTAAAQPAQTSSATGSSSEVTIIPYPCDGYKCPTDKPHCVLVREQCKALRCPVVPTCAAAAPVAVQCLVGHPVYDDMFSALTCGPRGDYNCPINSDCDETSGFATCCWTGSHGVNAATSKMEPTSYLLSAPKPRVQKSGDCPRSFQAGSCTNACINDSSCAGPQKCCSNGCGTACVDPVVPAPAPAPAPAQEAAGSCPVLGTGESCPSSTLCNSDSQCSHGSQCCFLSRTCRVCVNTVVGGTHSSGKGSSNEANNTALSSSGSGTAIPGLFPSNDQRFKAGNSISANSKQRNSGNEVNSAKSIPTAPSPGAGQGGSFQINDVSITNVNSQGSSGISGTDTASGMSSKATPQGSTVPQQPSGSGVGDVGRIRPGDLIVDILNHGANGSHAVISGMTNNGIVQLGRHRIGRVDGSGGTNVAGNGSSSSVAANVDAVAVSNVVAAALTDPSSAVSSASTSTLDTGSTVTAATSSSTNANFDGTGGVVSETSGSTMSAKGASGQSAVVDQTLPVSLDSFINAQGSSNININDVNSGTSGNVIADINLEGASTGTSGNVMADNNLGGASTGTSGNVIADNNLGGVSTGTSGNVIADINLAGASTGTSGNVIGDINLGGASTGTSGNVIADINLGGASSSSSEASVASDPTVSTTMDAGQSVKSNTLVDPSIRSGGTGPAGSVLDTASGGGGSATLGGTDRHLTLATNSGGVSANTVSNVIDAPGNGGNGVLNGEHVIADRNSGVPSTTKTSPDIITLDKGLSTGTIIHQGIIGNGQVVGIGTGDLGNVVSGQTGETSQSVLLPQGIPDQQGGLSQVVLDSPVGVTDVLGGSVAVGANAVGGINGVDTIGLSGIDGIHTGIVGASIDQQGNIGNNPSGILTDGTSATVLAGNGALSGTIDATGAISVPSDAAVIKAGSNSNTLENRNRDTLGASGSLLSNGITASGSGSSRPFQRSRPGSLGQPTQPRFQVEIETTHFAPHLQSGRRIPTAGGARRKHTSTSVKIGGGSNHFSTSVNIGHGGNSRQEVKINHNVAGQNGRHGRVDGDPRLQTSINIESSPDGHLESSRPVSVNTPRSQNYRQPEPVNRQTSLLQGASGLRGVATSVSGTSNRLNGIIDQLRPGSRPSYLASGSGNSLRSSASRSATITKVDPFVRPRTSSLSRSTIAGSTASRAIAAGNVVVNGGVTGIRGISGSPSRNTARSSPGRSGILLKRGGPRSVSDGSIGIGSNAASGTNTLGLSERPYSSATVTGGQYPLRSGSRVTPSVGNPGATHVDILGTSPSRSGFRGALSGLGDIPLAPPSDILHGSDFGQISFVTDPQGNADHGMLRLPRTNNVVDHIPATSKNVPPSSPTRSRDAELTGALKPSAFPLPSFDAATTKPGFCLKPCGFSLCINECNNDSQCPGSQKCCSSGCGRVCSPPFPYIPTIKPGLCPSSPSSAVCTRGHACSHDGECPGSSKCCCVGGGCRVCVLQGRSLPKMAPAPVLAPQTLPQFGMVGKGYVWR
ncbi:platelet binding protein GspB-like [Haliotis asinina]|uniref:platelet binding protein GspB-like n=1 Tax=Haliotis asinina TaxID=109174 RepID=UPI00353216B7